MTVEADTTAPAGPVPMTRATGDHFLRTVPLALVAFGCVVCIREAPLCTSNAVGDDHEDGSR
jgi:hypothetical protein